MLTKVKELEGEIIRKRSNNCLKPANSEKMKRKILFYNIFRYLKKQRDFLQLPRYEFYKTYVVYGYKFSGVFRN